jgi:hypothetical protein
MSKKDKIKNIAVWKKKMFKYRQVNDSLRIAQFKLDEIFINKFIKKLVKVGGGETKSMRCRLWNG